MQQGSSGDCYCEESVIKSLPSVPSRRFVRKLLEFLKNRVRRRRPVERDLGFAVGRNELLVLGGDLLGKPYLAVPYLSQGYGEKASRLIALALGNGDPAKEPEDRQIIDSWAQELGISSWYDWSELNE